MQQLLDRIQSEAKVLPGNIIKVDGFLNHKVDLKFLREVAKEFSKHFDINDITLVLTAEASGIPIASICAEEFNVPMLFAKKAKSDNIEGGLLKSEVMSYTYGKKETLLVSAEWLSKDDRVLIIDDFLAKGNALKGLIDIVQQAGATLVGIGVVVEKGFQDGGDSIRREGHNLKSLAIIEEAGPDKIVFRDQ